MVDKKMTKAEIIKASQELVDLILRCYQDNPDQKDLAELRKHLESQPDIYMFVMDISKVTRSKLTDLLFTYPRDQVARIALKANIKHLQQQLSYEQAPLLEKLLIDNVINCWIRLQWSEIQLSAQSNQSDVSIPVMEYWERCMNATQRRYLRACETLARVRRLTRNTPALQVNIALQEGKQLNVAGDIVKEGN